MAAKSNFKFLLLNKRDSNIKSKIDQINMILLKHKPQFMTINELQLQKYDSISPFQFNGYRMEHDNLDMEDGWSRTAILIKDSIKYKRRKDLELKGISTVWIQVGIPGTKSFLVQSLYRQFQRPGKKGTKSISSQLERWKSIINKWEKATEENREIITLGDTNLDSKTWNLNWNQLGPYDRQKHSMSELLKDKILSQGTDQVNTDFTRIENQPDGRKSCLDQIFTTNPEKMNSHRTHLSTCSDHAMIEYNKKAKNIKIEKKYIKIRSMKNFKQNEFKENLRQHPKYISTLYEGESQIITNNITTMLQDSLNNMAPVVRIQITSKNTTKLTTEAKQSLVDRDSAQKEAKNNPSIENNRRYKTPKKYI